MPPRPTVVLLGTFDTKGAQYAFLRDRLREQDADALLVDAGVFDPVAVDPDISRQQVAQAVGVAVPDLARANDRGAAVDAMTRGATVIIRNLRRRPSRWHHRSGRYRWLDDRDRRHARPSGRGTKTHGIDSRVRRHATVRWRRGCHNDVLRRRHLRRELGFSADYDKCRRGDSGDGKGRAAGGRRRPLIGATMFGVTTHA